MILKRLMKLMIIRPRLSIVVFSQLCAANDALPKDGGLLLKLIKVIKYSYYYDNNYFENGLLE